MPRRRTSPRAPSPPRARSYGPYALALALLACSSADRPSLAPAQPSLRTGGAHAWEGEIECEGAGGVGWGLGYECRAVGVQNPSAPSETFYLIISVQDAPAFDPSAAGVRAAFRRSTRPYGPPSGYKDPATNEYWVLLLP